MNRKLIIIIASVGIIALCGGIAAGGLAYIVLTNATKIEGVKIFSEQLSGMLELQLKLEETYPSDAIEILIAGGNTLRIDMINSGIANLSELERQTKAKEIALLTMETYDAINTIHTITITFTERVVIGIEFTKSMTYQYYTNDLR